MKNILFINYTFLTGFALIYAPKYTGLNPVKHFPNLIIRFLHNKLQQKHRSDAFVFCFQIGETHILLNHEDFLCLGIQGHEDIRQIWKKVQPYKQWSWKN